MAKETVLRKGFKLLGSLGSGTGDPLLTIDSTSKDIGNIPSIDTSTFLGTSLQSGYLLVGNGSNIATARQITGSIIISNTGVAGIAPNVITNTEINSAAAIAYSKLALTASIVNNDIAVAAQIARTKIANGTANRLLINNGSGVFSEASAITGSRLLVSDINGIPTASNVSTTVAEYLIGTSSAIQPQLNNKLSFSSAITPADGDIVYFTGGTWNRLPRGSSGQYLVSTPSTIQWTTSPNGLPTGGTANQYLTKVDGTDYNTQWSSLTLSKITDVTASPAQINVLATGFYDATTSVQGQLNSKLDKTLNQNYLLVGDASNLAVGLPSGTNGYILTSVSGVPTWVAPTGGGTVTSVAASGGTTGLSFTGTPITNSGTLSLTGTLVVANGGTGLTSVGAANTLLGVNNAGTALEYKVVSNGLTSSATSLVLGGTLTTNTTLTGNGASGDFTVTRTDTAKTNTLSLTNGGISLFSSHATQNEINIYATNGAGTNSIIDLIHTGITIDTPKIEVIGTAATIPTGGSLTTRNYVLGAKTFTGKQTFVASLTTAASLNIPSGTTPTTGITDGDVWQNSNHLYVRLNGVSYQLDQQAGGSGTFVGLTDGPGAFTGQALKGVRVNAGETALEYVALAGTGTVTTVSVVTANGISGSVANATTTPAITLTLGAITPSSVNSIVLSGSSTPTLAVTGTSSISGSNTGDQTITLTGHVTGSGTGSFATTIAAGVVTNSMLAGSIDLTTKVTGVLPEANGGTNSTAGAILRTGATTTGGVQTLHSNTPNGLVEDGTWTATANQQYHRRHVAQQTARATATDELYGDEFQHKLIAGAASQTLATVKIKGDFTPGAFSPTMRTLWVTGFASGAPLYIDSDTGVQIMRVTNAGVVVLGSAGDPTTITAGTRTLTFGGTSDWGANAQYVFQNGSNSTGTSGTVYGFRTIGGGFTPTAGSVNYIHANIQTSVNQTSTSSGNSTILLIDGNLTSVKGNSTLIDVNPTITTIAGTSYGLLMRPTGALNGFGTGTPTATLHVVGTTKLEGSVTLPVAGNGILIKEGTNATSGTGTLVAGTVTINNTSVTANSRIQITVETPGGTQGFISYSKVAGVSFTVTSTSATETSTFSYLIINPAP